MSSVGSQNCPHLPKASVGHSVKLTMVNINYFRHIIHMGKIGNATQASLVLHELLIPSFLLRNCVTKEMGPVLKRKKPSHKLCHRRVRMVFSERHLKQTIED